MNVLNPDKTCLYQIFVENPSKNSIIRWLNLHFQCAFPNAKCIYKPNQSESCTEEVEGPASVPF